MGWTRRSFLASLAMAALPGSFVVASEVDLEGFLELSARLAAVPRARLSPVHAARYLEALRAWSRPGDLEHLVEACRHDRLEQALREPRRRRLAEALLEAWYTGTVETPSGVVRVAGGEALAWDAIPYAGPPGTCHGR